MEEPVRTAEQRLRGICAEGDRQGGPESDGRTGKRRGDLRELRDRLTERFQQGVAGGGVEALSRAVHAVEKRLKGLGDELGVVKQQFREWRANVWQRVTGATVWERT